MLTNSFDDYSKSEGLKTQKETIEIRMFTTEAIFGRLYEKKKSFWEISLEECQVRITYFNFQC